MPIFWEIGSKKKGGNHGHVDGWSHIPTNDTLQMDKTQRGGQMWKIGNGTSIVGDCGTENVRKERGTPPQREKNRMLSKREKIGKNTPEGEKKFWRRGDTAKNYQGRGNIKRRQRVGGNRGDRFSDLCEKDIEMENISGGAGSCEKKGGGDNRKRKEFNLKLRKELGLAG